MKKSKIILLFVSLTLFNCDSYLDEVPDNRQEVKNLKDISEVLTAAYTEGAYNFLEWKTDNSVAIKDNSQIKKSTQSFQFVAVADDGQDTPAYYWNNSYTAIAQANLALEMLDKVPNTNAAFRDAIKGEALISRAYHHFMLANIFCQHYSAKTAQGLGIPYIKAPEKELLKAYDRETLESTYKHVEEDLLAGLALISDDFLTGMGKYHFNKAASYAFASRFYLYKGDNEKCISYSSKVLGEGVASDAHVKDIKAVFTGTSSAQISAQFNDVNSQTNLMVMRKASSFLRASRGYRADDATFDEILSNSIQGGSDYRDSRWGRGTDATYQPKYGELFELVTATTGYPYFIQPVFRSEEVIFNRMEAMIGLNKLTEALADYHVMAPLRYANGGAVTIAQVVTKFGGTTQEAMLKFVLSERRKEFLGEGLRWFDIKRHSLTVEHIDVVGKEFNLKADDLRKAIQIPSQAITQGIEKNPR